VNPRARIFLAAVLLEVGALWLRSGRFGGNVVARCRQGHLFTTIWIPGASVKSLRLGWWRVQRCPVGHHWSLVRPVRKSRLTEEERREAEERRDIRLP
jgi:hypothetical protein